MFSRWLLLIFIAQVRPQSLHVKRLLRRIESRKKWQSSTQTTLLLMAVRNWLMVVLVADIRGIICWWMLLLYGRAYQNATVRSETSTTNPTLLILCCNWGIACYAAMIHGFRDVLCCNVNIYRHGLANGKTERTIDSHNVVLCRCTLFFYIRFLWGLVWDCVHSICGRFSFMSHV